MDRYDLSHYQEADQEFVEAVSKMDDMDTIVLQLQDMDGKPLKETDGSLIEVPFSKSDCDSFLAIMRDKALTFNEVVVEALERAIKFDKSED